MNQPPPPPAKLRGDALAPAKTLTIELSLGEISLVSGGEILSVNISFLYRAPL